ncbi:MAG: ASKHA domain-containing protein [Pelosinus sp.]|nr:ASKHA domain-containing protein [Pelosinus sp.]
MQHTVIFKPSGYQGRANHSETILALARRLGVGIEAPCGGVEACGKCKVRIESGDSLSPLTEKEKTFLTDREIENGYRLACCTEILGSTEVFVPKESLTKKQVILETGRERAVPLKPAVKKYYLKLARPTLEDYRDDVSRIIDALYDSGIDRANEIIIDYTVLCALPAVLRQNSWRVMVTVWHDREIVAVQAAQNEGMYGISVDIGTTTIAACLCDLTTGEVLMRNSLMNSQVKYGDDVLSRITYCMNEDDGCRQLHKMIINDINVLVEHLTRAAKIDSENVIEMVLVFNTAMHHIALNINPEYLGCAPFIAAVARPLDIKARELGIGIAKGGYVHCLPIEAGFVGADNVAVLIAQQPYRQDEIQLVIDIGTNGEINLGCKDWLLSTSCATGPALEGAEIKCGMRAAAGAIEKIAINPATLEPIIKIIGQEKGDIKPIGICGSGIIDAVAEMFKARIILRDGRFNKEIQHERVRKSADGRFEYVLVWAAETGTEQDIVVSQKDIRAVQLAKAALYAGAKTLMQKKGVTRLGSVILAGAFGSYMNKENALLLGMFPDCDLDKVTVVGNAAGEGAKLALLNVKMRQEAAEIARRTQFIETAAEADFQTRFYEAMYFPHAKDSFVHMQKMLSGLFKDHSSGGGSL